MKVTQKYHASWIAAAERGEITWEAVSMLIEAFELGTLECLEALSSTQKTPSRIAAEATEIKNDSFQYLKNIGKEISYPPSGLNHSDRVDKIVNELKSTKNFSSRKLQSELKQKASAQK